jgi:hypothetical protein
MMSKSCHFQPKQIIDTLDIVLILAKQIKY